MEILLWDTSSRMHFQPGKIKINEKSSERQQFLYRECKLFKKYKYENVPKMKNKPDLALLQISYLYN
jgi:hypothetical protein